MRANIRQDGSQVILALNGIETALPYGAALAIAKALREKGQLAEEHARAISGELITDQAILQRAGMPFGLTSHPKIQAEAMKEAVSNRDLRRYMPGGIKSQRMIGTPTVIPSPPTPAQRRADQAFWATQGKDNEPQKNDR